MKRLLSILAAGTVSLLALCSCEVNYNTFDEISIDVYLTAYYSGGFPAETVQGTYDLHSPYLSSKDIESLFYKLSYHVTPGFQEAILEIEYYDWIDNYLDTEVFEFWWEIYDYHTGDGAYLWEQVR